MEFLNSASVSPLSWVPKPTWLHLILVDICLSEKGARGGQWEEGSAHSTLPGWPWATPLRWQGHGQCSHLQCIGLTFLSTDSHPSGPHSSLSQVGKALLSHFTVRETEPKRSSDLLKATQLADDGRN